MKAASNEYWLIPKKWPRRLFWLLIVAALIYVFPFTTIDGYTDRARVSELLVFTAEARDKVSSTLLKNPRGKVLLSAQALIPDTLGVRSKEGEKIEIAFRDIAENGEIKVYSPQLGVLLILTPKVVENKIKWSCWGRPLKIVPVPCRENS